MRIRLTAWFTAMLAFTLLLAVVGARIGIRRSIHDTVDTDLHARLNGMRTFLDTLEKNPDADPLKEELDEQAAAMHEGSGFRIVGPGGEQVFESPATKHWGPLALQLDSPQTILVDGQPVRVLAGKVHEGTMQIGVPLRVFYAMLDRFTWWSLLVSPILLILAAAGGYWMSRRALQPVDDITRTAQMIGARDLSLRLPVRGTGDELDRLSQTLNAMFARLENAFERITNFTADASHELRTPTAVIRTTAELARNRPRSQREYEQALDRILAESERTSTLIEDLLLLARADAGADALAREPVDLAEAVRDACAEARVLADAKGISLELEAIDEPEVIGDSDALRRSLLILLDNAIHYTPKGGHVRVTVAAEAGHAVLSVRDTGIGIGPEDLPHVFERFYRASKDRSRQNGGAGLGLSIAHWIAARHGGTITAESSTGAGSTFVLRIPVSSSLTQKVSER